MTKDSHLTIAAIALVAYLSADVAHHALGHGAACLALGGQIKLLSSVFVNCSLTGAVIDLAGPLANFLLGLFVLLAAHSMRCASSLIRLFFALVVAFNLFWFWLQLAFSATTMTDDWAWPMKQFHLTGLSRYGMIAVGIAGYLFTIRIVARQMTSFSFPSTRVRTIVGIAWVSAGIIAGVTAAFDHHAMAVMLRHALPQSLLSSIGLLFVPTRTGLSSTVDAATLLPLSLSWVVIAVLVGTASILLLGPGVSFTS